MVLCILHNRFTEICFKRYDWQKVTDVWRKGFEIIYVNFPNMLLTVKQTIRDICIVLDIFSIHGESDVTKPNQ